MSDPIQSVEQFLEPYGETHFYLACSGGVDSMALFHILHKLGKKLTVLHVNYQLRGEDSENDQKLIEKVCAANKIPLNIKRVNLQSQLEQHGGNLQDVARKVRYSFFETFLSKANSKIILAHHADDQVETFFLNLARDSGIMGLACMLAENENYLRPLLKFSKEEIISYAQKNKIEWREDKSNSSNKYKRNTLRNILLPQLNNEIPTLKQSILILTEIFQETQKELEKQISPLTKNILEKQQLSYPLYDQLNVPELMELLRQLHLPLSLHQELQKLRHSIKGKRIDVDHPLFDRIIHETEGFYFNKREKDFHIPKLKIEKVDKLPKSFQKEVLYLDPLKISGELQLRLWKEGDKMKLIGMKGSKLISDILSDAKIPSHLKSQQLILLDNQNILACIGFAVSPIAISSGSGEIIKVSIH